MTIPFQPDDSGQAPLSQTNPTPPVPQAQVIQVEAETVVHEAPPVPAGVTTAFQQPSQSEELRALAARVTSELARIDAALAALATSVPNGAITEVEDSDLEAIDADTVRVPARTVIDGARTFTSPEALVDIPRPADGFSYLTFYDGQAFLPHTAATISLYLVEFPGGPETLLTGGGVDYTYTAGTGQILLTTLDEVLIRATGVSSGSWTVAVAFNEGEGFYTVPVSSREPTSQDWRGLGHRIAGQVIGFSRAADATPIEPPVREVADIYRISHPPTETTVTLGEDVSKWDPLYLDSNRLGRKLTETAGESAPAFIVGLAETAGESGNTVRAVFKGEAVDDAWNWTTAQTALWLAPAGGLSVNPPNSGRALQVAHVLASDRIMVDCGRLDLTMTNITDLKSIVYDNLLKRFRQRETGEPLAGVSFLVPILTETKSTTSGTPQECGTGGIWDPTEFDVFETRWRAMVSQTGGSGTGTLELYNYTDASVIATRTIASGSTYAFHDIAVTLPTSGAVRLIGCRFFRATGSGTVLVHASGLRVREN